MDIVIALVFGAYILSVAYIVVDWTEQVENSIRHNDELLNKQEQLQSLDAIIDNELHMRQSELRVIGMLKDNYVTDPQILEKLEAYMDDDDIDSIGDMVRQNMKHHVYMANYILHDLKKTKQSPLRFLLPRRTRQYADTVESNAKTFIERCKNYKYEQDSDNQI